MNKKCFAGLAVFSLVGCAALVGVQFISGSALNADFHPVSAGDSLYSLTFNNSNVIVEGHATATTGLGNDFSVNLTNYEASNGAFCKLNTGGKIVGAAAIKGLSGIVVDFDDGGELVAGFGNSNTDPLPDRNLVDEARLETGYANGAAYFSIVARKDAIIRSIRLDYECSNPDVAISSIRVESLLSKRAYMINDAVASSDFAVYAVFGTNGDQRLSTTEYSVSLDTSSVGSKKATITYLADDSKTVQADVKVGSYEATGADVAAEGEKVFVTVSGTFAGLTQDEFKSFAWDADFQRHGTLNGDGNWDRDPIRPDFVTGEGTWSYKVDVTSYSGYYTGHLKDAPHVVDGDNELPISAAEDYSKRIKFGDKDYLLNYNLGKTADVDCWGNLGLKVFGHMDFEIIGTFDGWTGTGTTVCGRYNQAVCDWDSGKDFKFRQAGVWNENAWGYDQIDWASCPMGIVKRGSSSENRENNIIIVKGNYVMKLDLWTVNKKIIIGGNPFFSLVGNVNGQNWETGWGNDLQLTRTSSETFAVQGVSMSNASEFKVRTGADWTYQTYGHDELAGLYSRIMKKGKDSGHENNICINDEAGAGVYDVILNTKTGKLTAFRNEATYSVLGGFSSWADVDMVWDNEAKTYSATVDLTTEGEHWFKIRVGHEWGYEFDWNNIGSYPAGAFEKKGDGTDIYVKTAGRYTITLSQLTGKINILAA